MEANLAEGRRLCWANAQRCRVMLLPAYIAAIIIALYASLLTAGRWQGDEYSAAAQIMRHGFSVFWLRVTGWSPRPVGELLTYLYLSLSNHLDRPLIGTWLTVLWAASFAIAAAAASRARLAHPLALAAVLMALSLLIAKPGEMFYWPMAATAYLPCWAAMMAVTVLIMGEERRLALLAAFIMMAWSVEIGAVAALIFAGGEMPRLWRRGKVGPIFPWLAVTCCALAVCLLVLFHRVAANAEVMDRASGFAGHWLASALGATPRFTGQVIAVSGLPLVLGLALKISLLFLSPSRALSSDDRLRRIAWSLALFIAVWFSVVAALHEFGADCCERQNTLRQTMILLALVNLGGLITVVSLPVRALLLTVLLGILLAFRGPALAHDERLKPLVITERIQNWRSGLAPGPAMRLVLTPAGRIVNYDALPPGIFHAGGETPAPWYAAGIMERFGKRSLVITTWP